MREAKRTLDLLLRPYRPAQPIPAPLSVHIILTWPHLARTPQRDLDKRLPHVGRPDLDNSAKELLDALTRNGFFESDASVARLVLEKWRGPVPSLQFAVSTLAD